MRDAFGNRLTGALLFIGLVGLYVTVQYGKGLTWDGLTMANVTHNLVDHGRFITTHDVAWTIPDAKGPSAYGIGVSFLLIPFWLVQRAVDPNKMSWLMLANPLVTAATAVVVFRIGLALAWRRTAALFAALVFGLLTLAPNYTVDLFSEPSVGLCLATAVLGFIRWGQGLRRGPVMVGVAVAAAALFRYDSFVTVVPVLAAAPLFVPWRRLLRTAPTWLPVVVAPLAAVVGWTLYYNDLRFGSPFDFGGYNDQFHNPILEGLQRQLLSTGKGLLWYCPVVLLAVPGLVMLRRRHLGVAVVVAALFLVRVTYFAHWDFPDGGVAWGPRFLAPTCALLVLGLGELVERLPAVPHRLWLATMWALGVLLAASAVVTVASLWVPYTYAEASTNDVPGFEYLPSERLAAIKARQLDRLYNDWYWSPILVNLRFMRRPVPFTDGFPLRWWQGGVSTTGVASLAIGALGLAAAAGVATAGADGSAEVERSHEMVGQRRI